MEDYYDNYEAIEKEKKEEKIFNESYGKQLKQSKKVMVIVFYSLGLFYILLGIFINFIDPEEGKEILLIFSILGIVFIIVATIVLLIKFKVPNYKKFKERTKKYGYITSSDLLTRIEMLEKRVEELEKERKF